MEGLTGTDDGEGLEARSKRPERACAHVHGLDPVTPHWMPTGERRVHPAERCQIDLFRRSGKDGNEVEIADARVEPTGDVRAVEVDPEGVLAEHGVDVPDQFL